MNIKEYFYKRILVEIEHSSYCLELHKNTVTNKRIINACLSISFIKNKRLKNIFVFVHYLDIMIAFLLLLKGVSYFSYLSI